MRDDGVSRMQPYQWIENLQFVGRTDRAICACEGQTGGVVYSGDILGQRKSAFNPHVKHLCIKRARQSHFFLTWSRDTTHHALDVWRAGGSLKRAGNPARAELLPVCGRCTSVGVNAARIAASGIAGRARPADRVSAVHVRARDKGVTTAVGDVAGGRGHAAGAAAPAEGLRAGAAEEAALRVVARDERVARRRRV